MIQDGISGGAESGPSSLGAIYVSCVCVSLIIISHFSLFSFLLNSYKWSLMSPILKNTLYLPFPFTVVLSPTSLRSISVKSEYPSVSVA